MTDTVQLPPDFADLAANWNDLDPAQIDDSLYYAKGLRGNANSKDSAESEWFRALCFTLAPPSNQDAAPLNTFKKKLVTNQYMCCKIWMGIRKIKDSMVSYFEPFLEVYDSTPPPPPPPGPDTTPTPTPIKIARTFFKLQIVDHITLIDSPGADPTLEYLRKFIVGSDIIPKTFAEEMKSNWLHCSPAEMADHFKVISLENDLPSLKYVKSYTFLSAKNLTNHIDDGAINRISNFAISLGIDLNKKVMKLPVFSPILIYSIDKGVGSSGNAPATAAYDTFYEELSRPCPPTCH